MAKKGIATVKERRFAEAFLKHIGADVSNVFLVTAVIAWMRRESGKTYIGNNVFNIRHSKYETGFRIGKNGRFATFKTLDLAAKATAALLLSAKPGDYRGYDKVVKALRRANDQTQKGMQQQALDFLTALAMSKWSATHYGAPHGEPWLNKLVAVWSTILGLPPLPAEPVKPPRRRPVPPRDLDTNLLPAGFIDPYEARGFYNDRHGEVAPLTGGL
jgi:hypothetical protein